MKYSLLSKEQFEALHNEFAQFLATQKIDAALWKTYKATNDKIVAEELALFSDMVWDDVLAKVKYLNLVIQKEIYMFKVVGEKLHILIVKYKGDTIDFTTKEGLKWLGDNLKSPEITLQEGTRIFDSEAKKQELFKWIVKGAQITNGTLYESLRVAIA